MNGVKSLSPSKWRCKYHIVFAPKYRRQVIYIKMTDGKGAPRIVFEKFLSAEAEVVRLHQEVKACKEGGDCTLSPKNKEKDCTAIFTQENPRLERRIDSLFDGVKSRFSRR